MKKIFDKILLGIKRFLNGVLKAFCEFNDTW